MKPKYKVGDKVRIRSDCEMKKCSGPGAGLGVVSEMHQFFGQEATVSAVGTEYYIEPAYCFEGINYTWLESWLDPIEPEPEIAEPEYKYKSLLRWRKN